MDNPAANLPLADIHLPDAPGYWPLAPGWWILMGIALLIALVVFILLKRKKRESYRQQALIEFKRIDFELTQDQDLAKFLQNTNLLLKRIALTAHSKSFNASIKGNDWLQWLDQQSPKLNTEFSSDLGQALIIGQYQKAPAIEIETLKILVINWIKTHRNQWQQKSVSPKVQGEQAHV